MCKKEISSLNSKLGDLIQSENNTYDGMVECGEMSREIKRISFWTSMKEQ